MLSRERWRRPASSQRREQASILRANIDRAKQLVAPEHQHVVGVALTEILLGDKNACSLGKPNKKGIRGNRARSRQSSANSSTLTRMYRPHSIFCVVFTKKRFARSFRIRRKNSLWKFPRLYGATLALSRPSLVFSRTMALV